MLKGSDKTPISPDTKTKIGQDVTLQTHGERSHAVRRVKRGQVNRAFGDNCFRQIIGECFIAADLLKPPTSSKELKKSLQKTLLDIISGKQESQIKLHRLRVRTN